MKLGKAQNVQRWGNKSRGDLLASPMEHGRPREMCRFHTCSHTHKTSVLLPQCHGLTIINSVHQLREVLPLDLGVDSTLAKARHLLPRGWV